MFRGQQQGPGFCLSVTSGLDQASIRIPRNQLMTKEWAKLYRPSMHMIGGAIDGVLEGFYDCDQDTQHNPNQVISVLNRGLDKAEQIIKTRTVEMPRHLNLLSDNATKEGTTI